MMHSDADLMLAAGAALGDLEPDELVAYEAHRAGCRQCAVTEDELSTVLVDLALAVPERLPPPDLLAGIRLAIDAEERRGPRGPQGPRGTAAAADAIEVRPTVAPPSAPATVLSIAEARARRRPMFVAVGLAAGLALVAVGLGARTVDLQRNLDTATAQVVSLQEELGSRGPIMAAALDPAHQTIALRSEPIAQGANAVVMFVPGTDSSWIVAEDLPATPSGHGYQLWYADEDGVHALQTVPYDGSGAFVGELGVDLAASKAVMITLEETGGAQGDPGPQVVFGEL